MKSVRQIDKNPEYFILRILLNEATESEILEFSEWMKNEDNRHKFEQIKLLWCSSSQKIVAGAPCNSSKKVKFIAFIQKEKRRRRQLIVCSVGVAVALLFVSFFILINQYSGYQSSGDTKRNLISEIISSDKINPEAVVLTTADGIEHIIDEAVAAELINVAAFDDNKILHHIASTGSDKTEYNTLYVPRGKRICVRLSDSTIMWVNSDTKVKYPAVFPKNCREVSVEGNVYFEVAKDSLRPFSVKTGIVTTVALGTIFEVYNYDKIDCRITLLEGVVKVDNTQQEILMEPNQQVIVTAGKETLECVNIDGDKYGRWKDETLVFDNEPFIVVLDKLSRWHNIDIINEASDMKDLRFSGILDSGTLAEHLKIITDNIKLKYLIKDNKALINP